ncbi:MAG TPA: nicotinate phosphoribosyltransferase [Myxococcales bacterium]|jgi:nicotinate phosphoribosyltransferase
MHKGLYGQSLALLTDLYELTMAAAAWKSGIAEREAVFHLTFRKAPFHSGYTVAAGLGPAVEFIRALEFSPDDLAYLATLEAAEGEKLFEPAFLDWLTNFRPRLDLDAIPEGTVVFPQEPLLRVTGPIAACMLLETPLLTLINFQTLIATKSARICQAARGEPVIEFGLRRAQGIDGALSAARAAFIGGAVATSNVLAGKLLGIPVRGTHAHSWVMCFEDELEAFRAYARAMPANVVLLVDTYDTLRGVEHAIEIGRELRSSGHELLGIRLDSGDLAWLSVEARKLLDAAGFEKTEILATNDLDENIIDSLKAQGARIVSWGVGTRLVTAYDEPALGGIYKLAAVREGEGWSPRIKISEQTAKTSIPGILQVRRFTVSGELRGDMIYDVTGDAPGSVLVDPLDPTRRKGMPQGALSEDLLVPVIRKGETVYAQPPLEEVRARTQAQLAQLHPAIKRLVNPHLYPVGLQPSLHERRTRMILEARQRK